MQARSNNSINLLMMDSSLKSNCGICRQRSKHSKSFPSFSISQFVLFLLLLPFWSTILAHSDDGFQTLHRMEQNLGLKPHTLNASSVRITVYCDQKKTYDREATAPPLWREVQYPILTIMPSYCPFPGPCDRIRNLQPW